MYVTGGLGPKESNEGFTEPYDLPNETAYAETCASVALVFWAQRMLHLDLDGAYADVMERALYNGALSGLSREGTHYFYANPAREPRPAQALGVARLPLLHDERLAAGRVGRRLFSLDPRRRRRHPPLRRLRRQADDRRRRREASRRPATIRGPATSASRSIPKRRRLLS